MTFAPDTLEAPDAATPEPPRVGPTMLRLAVTRRWIGYLFLGILFAAICAGFSYWQFQRKDTTDTAIQRIENNWNATPVQLHSVLPQTSSALPDADQWKHVSLTGHYVVSEELLARNRPRNETPGFEVLVPFELADGTVLIVDRGWLPTGNSQYRPKSVPAAPSGTATVVVNLRPGEPTLAGKGRVAGQVETINLPQIAGDVAAGPVYTGAYGQLRTENPAPASAPERLAKPQEDPGPHLSYALQWPFFGLMAFAGWVYGLRQAARRVLDPDDEITWERKPRRKNDGDIEDDILDAD